MYQGYRVLFWGVFFATFHLNLGPIEILPTFVGWMIVGNGLKKLYENHPSDLFSKAKTFVYILILLSFIAGIQSFFFIHYEEGVVFSVIWPVLFGIMELLTEYKILEGSVEYFEKQNNQKIAEEYVSRIKDYTIGFIIFLLLQCIAMTFLIDGLIIMVAIMGIVLRIWFMAMMSFLKKLCEKDINHNTDNSTTE